MPFESSKSQRSKPLEGSKPLERSKSNKDISDKSQTREIYFGGDAKLGNKFDPERYKDLTARDLTGDYKCEERTRAILVKEYLRAQDLVGTGGNKSYWSKRLDVYSRALDLLQAYKDNRKVGTFDEWKEKIASEGGIVTDACDALVNAVKEAKKQISDNKPMPDIPRDFMTQVEKAAREALTIKQDTGLDDISPRITSHIINDANFALKSLEEVNSIKGLLRTEIDSQIDESFKQGSYMIDDRIEKVHYDQEFNNKLRSHEVAHQFIEQYETSVSDLKSKASQIDIKGYNDSLKGKEHHIKKKLLGGRRLVDYEPSNTDTRRQVIEAIEWHKALVEVLSDSRSNEQRVNRILSALQGNADYIRTLTGNEQQWSRDGFLTWADRRNNTQADDHQNQEHSLNRREDDSLQDDSLRPYIIREPESQ